MMFKVVGNEANRYGIYTSAMVYDIRVDTKGVTKFLLYKNDKWQWYCADDFKPA